MPVVTLISDVGTQDYQIPAVKGFLLSRMPDAQIVDLSHDIEPFHILHAAYVLGYSFREFPKGSIHIVGVEGDFSRKPEYLAAYVEGHYFVLKNTGLLSLITEEEPDWVVRLPITSTKSLKFPLRDILADGAVKVAQHVRYTALGKPADNLRQLTRMQPLVSSDTITGSVIFNNKHNNAITNVHRKLLDHFNKFNKVKVNYNRNDAFDRIYNAYNDVPEGAAVCFFNSNGLLEIGIHGGNAADLLSLYEGKKILIEFEE